MKIGGSSGWLQSEEQKHCEPHIARVRTSVAEEIEQQSGSSYSIPDVGLNPAKKMEMK